MEDPGSSDLLWVLEAGLDGVEQLSAWLLILCPAVSSNKEQMSQCRSKPSCTSKAVRGSWRSTQAHTRRGASSFGARRAHSRTALNGLQQKPGAAMLQVSP